MKWIYQAMGLPSPNKCWRKYMEKWVNVKSWTRNTYDNEVERQLVWYGSAWLCICFPTSPRLSLYSQGLDFYLRGQVLIDASPVPPAAPGTGPGIVNTWLHVAVRKVEIWTSVATLNWSWPLRQVFIRNESKTSWFHWPCLRNKADSHTSLLGQNKSSPNATQRTKGCRCSDEHSGINNKGCLLERLTNVHPATISLTLGRKIQQLNRWHFFLPIPDFTALSFPVAALGAVWPIFSPCLHHWCCACPWETPPQLHKV